MSEKRYSMTVPGGFVAKYTATELDLVIKNAKAAKVYADRDMAEAEKPKYGDVGFTHAERVVFYWRNGWKDKDGVSHTEVISPVKVWFNIYDLQNQGPIVIGMMVEEAAVMVEDPPRPYSNPAVRVRGRIMVALARYRKGNPTNQNIGVNEAGDTTVDGTDGAG